jgi:hypothetical protein
MYQKPIASYNVLFNNYWDYNKLNNQEISSTSTIISLRLNAGIFTSGTYYHIPFKIEARNITQNTAYQKLTRTQYNLNFDEGIQVDINFKKFAPSDNKNRIIIIRRDDIYSDLTGDNINNLKLVSNSDYDRDDNFVIIAQDSTDPLTYKMYLYYQNSLYMTIFDNVYKKNVNYNVLGCYQIWELADDSTYPSNVMPIANSPLRGSISVYNWDNNILRREAIGL